jgi:TRAP-type transport system small permease protein
MHVLSRIVDGVTKAAATVVLLALLTSVVLGVLGRLLNEPLVWSDELARYLMVWLALIGWIMASRHRSHIRITLILNRLPSGLRRAVEIVIQAALAVFGMALMRDGFTLVERNMDVESVSMPISSAVIYVPIVLAGASTMLQALVQVLEQFRRSPSASDLALAGGKPL